MTSKANQTAIMRFTATCQADPRVVAAFIGGSYAAEQADEYSDLDLYLITTEEGYDAFFADRQGFMEQLGRPVFLEDLNLFGFDMIVFMLEEGVEGELGLAAEQKFSHIHGGPFKVLVDKQGLLAAAEFPLQGPTAEEQQATLSRLLIWFWRDVSLFTTAIARENLWTAYGHLESMRVKCVNLARLKRNFTHWADGYQKLERAADHDDLSRLQSTFCPLSRQAMGQAAHALLEFYRETAPGLAQAHGIPYPADLDRVVSSRLEDVTGRGPTA